MTSSTSDLSQPVGSRRASASPSTFPFQSEATLVDAVDHLLDRGAVVVGEATISLAGIDLIYVGLNLLVSSVETLRKASPETVSPPRTLSRRKKTEEDAENGSASSVSQPEPEVNPSAASPREGGENVWPLASSATTGAGEVKESPASGGGERPEQGLARLVLTLVELLRQTLERQAVRRMEGGSLPDEDLERMGVALLELEQKMVELREIFGLEEADLNLDLGPLGKLL